MNTCPICGAASPEALEGQCSVCLLALANAAQGDQNGLAAIMVQSRQIGDYVLGRQLGGGGMGVVYEARQVSLNRKVALKLIRDGQVMEPVSLRRFTIEAEAAARLDHPNIVPVYEIGELDGLPFFSMGLIEGENLGEKIGKGEFAVKKPSGEMKRTWRERQTALAHILVKLARAVHHAHQRGVVHRDLKPANILIDVAGEPHLTDFGVAKILEMQQGDRAQTLTNPEDILGTLSYMSPEQADGRKTTYATDLYGLGAVMYALLTGRPPFKGSTPLETLKQVLEQPPVPPRMLNPLAHQDLDTICMKCLEKNPGHRYASAEALAVDLQHWLAGRPILARPAGPLRRTVQWIKRNPVGTAFIVSLCLGLTISLGLLHMANLRKKDMARRIDKLSAESLAKIDQFWTNPEIKTVTISEEELAALSGRPMTGSDPIFELSLAMRCGLEPSSTAQKHARQLEDLQQEMRRELGGAVAFNLMLFKTDEMMAQGNADFMLLSAVEYLKIKEKSRGLAPLGRDKNSEGVIFANSDAGLTRLEQLRGKRVALPNPIFSLTLQAKARLVDAGMFRNDLRACTSFVDQGPVAGQVVDSQLETMLRVFKGEFDAGATSRKLFERSPYTHLVEIGSFPIPGDLYVARAAKHPEDQKLFLAFQKAAMRVLKLKPVDDAYFDELSGTLKKARQFDGEEVAKIGHFEFISDFGFRISNSVRKQ